MTMQEYQDKTVVTKEMIQREVFRFLKGRKDTVLVGAWAVNSHTPLEDERQTSDIDFMTTNIKELAVLASAHINAALGIAAFGQAFPRLVRIYRKVDDKEQGLIDVIWTEALPDFVVIGDCQIATVEALIQMKTIASEQRQDEAKRLTDLADIVRLKRVLAQKQ